MLRAARRGLGKDYPSNSKQTSMSVWQHSDIRSSAVTLMLTSPRYFSCSKIKKSQEPTLPPQPHSSKEPLNIVSQLARFLWYTYTAKSQKFSHCLFDISSRS